MAAMDQDRLLELLEHRWDWYSARALRTQMLAELGLEGHRELRGAELERLAEWLENPERRAAAVAAELRSVAASNAGSQPMGQPPQKPVEQPVEQHGQKAVEKAPPPFEVRVGGEVAQKLKGSHAQPLRIVSARAGTVRWGVNGWKSPPAPWRPAGTHPVDGAESVETKLVAASGAFVLDLAPPPANVRELSLNVRFDDGSWAKDVAIAFS